MRSSRVDIISEITNPVERKHMLDTLRKTMLQQSQRWREQDLDTHQLQGNEPFLKSLQDQLTPPKHTLSSVPIQLSMPVDDDDLLITYCFLRDFPKWMPMRSLLDSLSLLPTSINHCEQESRKEYLSQMKTAYYALKAKRQQQQQSASSFTTDLSKLFTENLNLDKEEMQ